MMRTFLRTLFFFPFFFLFTLGIIAFLFALIGFCFTSAITQIDMYSYFFTLFITPMFIFSGIFFPLENLPAWVQAAAWLTPLYHAVGAVRPLMHGTVGLDVLHHLAWMVVVSLILFPIAVRRMSARMIH